MAKEPAVFSISSEYILSGIYVIERTKSANRQKGLFDTRAIFDGACMQEDMDDSPSIYLTAVSFPPTRVYDVAVFS